MPLARVVSASRSSAPAAALGLPARGRAASIELGQRPGRRRRARSGARTARSGRGERLLVAAEAVVEHRARPLRRRSAPCPRRGVTLAACRPSISARPRPRGPARRRARARRSAASRLPVASVTASSSSTSAAAAARSPAKRCTPTRAVSATGARASAPASRASCDLAGGEHVPALVVPQIVRDVAGEPEPAQPVLAARRPRAKASQRPLERGAPAA